MPRPPAAVLWIAGSGFAVILVLAVITILRWAATVSPTAFAQ